MRSRSLRSGCGGAERCARGQRSHGVTFSAPPTSLNVDELPKNAQPRMQHASRELDPRNYVRRRRLVIETLVIGMRADGIAMRRSSRPSSGCSASRASAGFRGC